MSTRSIASAMLLFTMTFTPVSASTTAGGDSPTFEKLSYSSIDREDIQTAPCRDPVDVEQLQKEMEGSEKASRETVRLRGFLLKDEAPSLVNALAALMQRTNETGRPLETQPKISAHEYLKTLCDDAVCVAQRLFGKTIGIKMLYLRWKYDLNASHMTNEKAAHIEDPEIDSFLRVASDFPQLTLTGLDDQRMVKYERGTRMISKYGGISMANSKMEFFDYWSMADKNEKDLITAHELAHVIGETSGMQSSRGWRELGGWKRKDGTWFSTERDSLISRYSKYSPAEDFAESVVAYRYAADELSDMSPSRYQFLKEFVFMGREYRSPKQCEGQ